ncbi:MAG: flagellar basal body P-ring protein FlgI [Rhodocyclaceae bacterium]
MRVLFLSLLLIASTHAGNATALVRLKDIGRFENSRETQLVGYGVVMGLAGTGDSARSRATRQSIANLLSRFDIQVPRDQIQSKNVATVIVTAAAPVSARPGDKIDLTVSSLGDARSLLGGTLLLTALKSPDGGLHALAQGPLTVGGYRYDANGNAVQKNHPTTATVTAGGTVESGFDAAPQAGAPALTYVLRQADLATAHRVSKVIMTSLPRVRAQVKSASTVEITSDDPAGIPEAGVLADRIEQLTVEPDAPARVVVNERTGTVVAGGDVRISPVTITQGDIKVSIMSDTVVSQPGAFAPSGYGVRTVVGTRTSVGVGDEGGAVVNARNTVSDLVQALGRIKIGPRDTIAILQSMRAAGALHADLIIQ